MLPFCAPATIIIWRLTPLSMERFVTQLIHILISFLTTAGCFGSMWATCYPQGISVEALWTETAEFTLCPITSLVRHHWPLILRVKYRHFSLSLE